MTNSYRLWPMIEVEAASRITKSVAGNSGMPATRIASLTEALCASSGGPPRRVEHRHARVTTTVRATGLAASDAGRVIDLANSSGLAETRRICFLSCNVRSCRNIVVKPPPDNPASAPATTSGPMHILQRDQRYLWILLGLLMSVTIFEAYDL